LKRVISKITPLVFAVLLLCSLTGCGGILQKKELLTVDFKKDLPLRYKFVSSRDIDVEFNLGRGSDKAGKEQTDKFSESIEMTVAYIPTEVDPYGLTTIKATCESVNVQNSKAGRRVIKNDAVEYFAGKNFTFTVDARGKIEDYSQLNELIKQAGEKAFRPNTKQGRVKEPDMISDFVAAQWFLWDAVSSIEKYVEGVSPGQSWKSKLSIPTPMVMRKARDVTYTFAEVRNSPKGHIAVIRSSYSPAKSVPDSWPIPYTGRFQMSGTFGFLTNYKMLDLKGEGEELFNIDAGRTEEYKQHYQMNLEASLPMGLGSGIKITIKQNLTMQLLENEHKK
jgi:hypothetical protein